MKERAVILTEADRLRREGHAFALATVVKINGSTYRRPGARMLVAPDGHTWGTISGGCLEQEVAQQALETMETGQAQVQPFDLSDDDLILGFGTGCNGAAHVLIEPVPAPGRADPLTLMQAALDQRQISVLATVIEVPPAQDDLLARRVLFLSDGTTQGDIEEHVLRQRLLPDAAQVLAGGRPEIRSYTLPEGMVEVLLEVVAPSVRLVIFGSGHDVPPVIAFAKELGWEVVLVGRKPPEDLAARFPQADEHVFLMHPAEVQKHVALDVQTAAVVMNHHYERDKALVGALLDAPVCYIGALGPRERTERMIDELGRADPSRTDAYFDRLHGPVGLDIGTETPQQIALSMVAEIQAVLHDRTGGMLRNRAGRIHEAVPTG